MTLGMTFAGGGCRGSVELGIVKALYEKGIRPTIFTGTSAGSIVTGLLATGHDPEESFQKLQSIGSHIMDVAYGHILKGMFSPANVEGLVKGNKLMETLDQMFDSKGMRHLNGVKVGMVATDIQTGKEIIFSNAYPTNPTKINNPFAKWIVDMSLELAYASRYSCSFPAVFIPETYCEHVLVDGGLVNNAPSDVARALGADQVITIDLGYDGKKQPVGGIASILFKSLDILMMRVTEGNEKDHGIYINPEVYDAGAFDFSKMEELFERGYKYGTSISDRVADLLAKGESSVLEPQ